MKKIVSAIMAVTMIIASAIAFSGCKEEEDYLPEYENGYFVYAVRTNKDGTKDGYLVGLTEEGRKQKYLILPKELDGIRIKDFVYMRKTIFMGSEEYSRFSSITLKKLFVPFEPDSDCWRAVRGYSCPNCYLFKWGKGYMNFMGKGFMQRSSVAQIMIQNIEANGYITSREIANVSYFYNYEGAPNDGYYWTDSYDNTTIDFVPPAPTREGYTFAGWYKEPECINAWNYKTDVTKNEIVITAESTVEEVRENLTELYALWI